jgi:hypothetical protein
MYKRMRKIGCIEQDTVWANARGTSESTMYAVVLWNSNASTLSTHCNECNLKSSDEYAGSTVSGHHSPPAQLRVRHRLRLPGDPYPGLDRWNSPPDHVDKDGSDIALLCPYGSRKL